MFVALVAAPRLMTLIAKPPPFRVSDVVCKSKSIFPDIRLPPASLSPSSICLTVAHTNSRSGLPVPVLCSVGTISPYEIAIEKDKSFSVHCSCMLSDDEEVRRRQLAAIHAKNRGTYTSGGGGRAYHDSVAGRISSTAGEAATVAAVAALAPALAPIIVPAYEAYKVLKVGEKIIDAYEKSHGDINKTATVAKREVVSYAVSEVTGIVSAGAASTVASSITTTAVNSGVVSTVATSTGVNPDVLKYMLEGSISAGLQEASGEVASIIVEAIN